jgi:hypothetical protein
MEEIIEIEIVSLDEAYEQGFLEELVCEEYEGVLHEREYVDEIPMSDAVDIFLQKNRHVQSSYDLEPDCI